MKLFTEEVQLSPLKRKKRNQRKKLSALIRRHESALSAQNKIHKRFQGKDSICIRQKKNSAPALSCIVVTAHIQHSFLGLTAHITACTVCCTQCTRLLHLRRL